MVIPAPNYERMYELAKGEISVGNINMLWDFTDGLTKEQWINRFIFRNDGYFITKDGKILMPKLGIL